MFSDPLVALMVMLLLCFIGMLVMFLFVIRSLSTQNLLLREGFRRHENILADLEKQFLDMSFSLRQGTGKPAPESAEQTAAPVEDDLRSLFEHVDPTDAFGQRQSERSTGSASLFSSTRPATADAYPSAAGLDPIEDDISRLSLGRDGGDSGIRNTRTGTRQPGGLDLRLDR